MNTRHLVLWLPCLVILAMLANLITPAPVLAAGEPPPPPGEKSPKNPAAPDKPASPETDTSYAAEIPVTAPAGAPDGAANAAAVALSVDAIAQAGAVLVGLSGNPLPLATRDSADVLAIDDVYFKGSGAGCAAGWCKYDTITEALLAFPAHNGTGSIFATGDLNELTAVDVVSTPVLNLSKLTGLAWDGTTNYTPRITGGLLTIQNMLKGFSVDGFYISMGISAHDNAGTLRFQNLSVTNPAGAGILVENHLGSIDLFNVTVTGASESGTRLDNRAGAGNVTVGNSAFNNNNNYGINIHTNGSVLLDRVTANGNVHSDGAYLVMQKGATVKDSRFNGNGNLNACSGLLIEGTRAISLQNVEARANTSSGVGLNTTNEISINAGSFSYNLSNGLNATSSGGNITLNNVTTQTNAGGVALWNHLSATPKTVTVSNSQFLATTAGPGLAINSKGNVTLNHIRAEGNNGDGITIDNAQLAGGVYTGSGSVSFLNTLGGNELVNNHDAAIDIKSKGAITLKGVNASNNHNGLKLDNCAINQNPDPLVTHYCLGKGNLSVTATRVLDTDGAYGLDAQAGGAITLDDDTFLNNTRGVTLNNAPVSSAKLVTVTSSTFSNTLAAGVVPLSVLSKGNITLNNVRAFNNLTTKEVIMLDNCFVNGGVTCTGSGSVSLLNSLGATLLMENNATQSSLSIFSHGAVTLTGVVDDFNNTGANVDNLRGTAAVTVSKSSFSHNITNGGLYVVSSGKITLTSVIAAYNSGGGGFGAILLNATTTAPASSTITISKSVFDYNRNYGLQASSKGSLTANNISAAFNTGPTAYGANLVSQKGNVALQDSQGANQFSYNSMNGLTVYGGDITHPWGGMISITGVTASNNGTGYGIKVDNRYATTTKAVTIQKVRADTNGLDGLDAFSKGNITLNNVQANSNPNGWGANVDNCLFDGAACTGSGNVTILSTLGPNSMNYNTAGLRIDTLGSVAVNGVTASYNISRIGGVSGLVIYNQHQTAVQKPATVTKSSFDTNQGTGLYIYVTGVVTLNGISASYNNGGYGLFVDNVSMPGSPGASILATLGNNQVNNNAHWGMIINSSGSIALNKVTANDNGWYGAFLMTPGASSISVTCSVLNRNGNVGLFVSMGSGALNFKGLAANDNNSGAGDLSLGGKVPVVSWTVCGK